jgi:hypothetical protein
MGRRGCLDDFVHIPIRQQFALLESEDSLEHADASVNTGSRNPGELSFLFLGRTIPLTPPAGASIF